MVAKTCSSNTSGALKSVLAGGGLIGALTLAWNVYEHFSPKTETSKQTTAASQSAIATNGGTSINADRSAQVSVITKVGSAP